MKSTEMCGFFAIERASSMSIQTLKIDLESRHGPDLLPNSFPIELLIVLTRELTMVADRVLAHDELSQMGGIVKSYLRRVVEMQGVERVKCFDERSAELTPPLVQELYECLSEEIVSRFICYDVRSSRLRDRIAAVFEDEARRNEEHQGCAPAR